VIRIRPALTATAASLLTGLASPSWAQDSNASNGAGTQDTPANPRPVIVAIDADSIPIGTLPPAPSVDDAPASADAEEEAPGIAVQKMKNPPPRKKRRAGAQTSKLPSGLAAKRTPTELVELSLDHAEAGALYVPAPDTTDFAGETVGGMPCRRQDQVSPSPVRWETATASGDRAEIAVKDLWFYSGTCTVRAGAASAVAFKAVAWDSGKPWLYALRDDRSVTFLMPRSTDVTAEASVGAPVTVRGGFTRVTLPLGRWGSSSFVAHISSMTLDAPLAPAPPGPPGKGLRARLQEKPPAPADPFVEVGVELVQTMSEKTPSLLVRRVALDTPVASRLGQD
jgi:hypothetical protein